MPLCFVLFSPSSVRSPPSPDSLRMTAMSLSEDGDADDSCQAIGRVLKVEFVHKFSLGLAEQLCGIMMGYHDSTELACTGSLQR